MGVLGWHGQRSRRPMFLLLPALFGLALLQPSTIQYPLEGAGVGNVWPLALLVWYGML